MPENRAGPAILYGGLHHMREWIEQTVLYAGLPADELLRTLAEHPEENRNKQRLALLRMAQQEGFTGSLWQMYLTRLMVMTEQPFGLAAEGGRVPPAELQELARQEYASLRRLFLNAPEDLNTAWPGESATPLAQLRDRLAEAPDDEAFYQQLLAWFQQHGCGAFGVYRAFRVRWVRHRLTLLPVKEPDPVRLSDLMGYELQKARLRTNVKSFLDGKPYNNMLLYGDAGTGKSTSIRALGTEYADRGLRLIEISADEFGCIPDLVALLRQRRYHFLLMIDDLSYDDGDNGYRYLKAAMEGGLEVRPGNVMLCATSNRRHLVKETWKDRSDMEHDGDIHRSDTIEEKLSLAGRFGCLIQFYASDRKLYREIVLTLARQHPELDIGEDEILAAAGRWEIRHGGLTGRTAQQFVNALVSGEAT